MVFQYDETTDYAKDVDDLISMCEFLKSEGDWSVRKVKRALSLVRRKASAMMLRVEGFDLKGDTWQKYVGEEIESEETEEES